MACRFVELVFIIIAILVSGDNFSQSTTKAEANHEPISFILKKFLPHLQVEI